MNPPPDNSTKRSGRPAREFGDWRLPLENPAEAEHLEPLPLTLWERVRMQVECLEGADATIVPLHGWPRVIRLSIAMCLLLPLSVVTMFALVMQLWHAAPRMGFSNFWLTESVWYTLVGLAAFASLSFTKCAERLFIYIYVLGHESTHAIAAVMSFGKISDFRFSHEGGYVETDADNIFIALSPYFVPFWMLVWMLVFWGINHFFPFDAYIPWFYGGMGYWWAFHLYWTFWVIPREQPDLLENGRTFSMLVIILMNVAVLLGVLWLFGVITPQSYGTEFITCAERIYDTFRFVFLWLLT